MYYQRVRRNIRSLSDLTPLIVGAKEGDALIGLALQENPKLYFKLYADYAGIVEAAREAEIDAFLMDDPPASYHLVRHGILHRFNRLPLATVNHLHVATWKGNTAVSNLLRRGLAMFSREELDLLLRPYLLERRTFPPWLSRFLFPIAEIATVISLILLAFVYLLRRRIAQVTQKFHLANERLLKAIATFAQLPLLERKEEVFSEILDLALEVIPKARSGSAMVYTKDGGARIVATRGHSKDILGFVLPKEDLIPAPTVTLVEDILSAKYFSSGETLRKVLSWCRPIRETLIVPLYWEGQSFGRLSIDIPQESRERFSESDRQVMAYFAGICTAFHALRTYAQREQRLFEKLLAIFTKALEYHDTLTRGHSEAAACWALEMARRMHLGGERTRWLLWASLLHDVGKIFVPQAILQKSGTLTEEEYRLVKLHPMKGAELIREVEGLEEIARIVHHHHEWWNGKGYPDGLVGEAIPLESRIVAVLDAFEAMTSNRPYCSARSIPETLEELKNWSGIQFDPQVVDIFVAIVSEATEVRQFTE